MYDTLDLVHYTKLELKRLKDSNINHYFDKRKNRQAKRRKPNVYYFHLFQCEDFLFVCFGYMRFKKDYLGLFGPLNKQKQTCKDAILVRGDMYNWRFLLSSGIF